MSNTNLNAEQFRYFHGTGGGIKGDVKPLVPEAYKEVNPLFPELSDPAAYATASFDGASRFAAHKSEQQGRLFGSVYEVEPKVVIGNDAAGSKYGIPAPTGAPGHIADPEGLNIVRHAAFVDHNGDRL
jgi:hypothetical protein